MKTNKNNFNNISLTEPMLAILLTLSGEILHGYDLKKRIIEETPYDIPTGTLYRNLAKLLDNGLIKECPQPPEEEDERRRYYTTTGLGEQIADAEIDRMKNYVRLREPGFAPSARWGGVVWTT